MGVRGLQTFLKNNSQFMSTSVVLNNTTIIIDSANLLCCLFSNLCLEPQSPQNRCDIYGGDLVAYANVVRKFFESLEQCNITPVLVFDGSVIGKQSTSSEIALKENTIYRRGIERFESSKTITETRYDDKLSMSKLLSNVFKEILAELGIQSIQCPYEADSHIARLANDLNCPVLTNDSDFIIYSLPIGFIMLDSFEHGRVVKIKEGTHGIRCNIFSQRTLAKSLRGLGAETMPLLSILLGNDYVETGTFDRVLDMICGGYYNGSFHAPTFNHRRIAKLLEWMRGKTLDEAMERILNLINPPSRRESLRRLFLLLLRNYKIEQTDNLDAEINAVYLPHKPAESSHKPAEYMRTFFERYKLTSLILDMVFHNTYYNYPVIDDFTITSSNYVSFRAFAVALTLLRPRSYRNMTTYQKKIQSEKDAFYLYDRVKGQYSKLVIRPMESLENFGSLENMDFYSLMSLDKTLKQSMLMSVFRFNRDEYNLINDTLSRIFTAPFVHETSICLLLIKYTGIETKKNPKPQFVNAILMTVFYYASIGKRLNDSGFSGVNYQNFASYIESHSLCRNGKTYQPSEQLYKRIVHFINQLQSAYLGYFLLNNLLEQVFQPPKLGRFFNSTLIFRLTKLLRLGDSQLESAFKSLPILFDTFRSLRVIVNCADE